MKRIASIHIYDALETIQISAVLRCYDTYEDGASELELERHTSLSSRGCDSPHDWLGDALVCLLETI